MAVIYEDVEGTELVRAYSDAGFLIHGGIQRVTTQKL